MPRIRCAGFINYRRWHRNQILLCEREFNKYYLTSPPAPLCWRQPAVRHSKEGSKKLNFPFKSLPLRLGATVYTQVQLPPLESYRVYTSPITPLNPPDILGGKRNLVPSPIYRGGLGWGKIQVRKLFHTCVYTLSDSERDSFT